MKRSSVDACVFVRACGLGQVRQASASLAVAEQRWAEIMETAEWRARADASQYHHPPLAPLLSSPRPSFLLFCQGFVTCSTCKSSVS
eukprot:COSAG05_NODE_687_length_7922_cov_7.188035_5_plen_87_part_00